VVVNSLEIDFSLKSYFGCASLADRADEKRHGQTLVPNSHAIRTLVGWMAGK
jgi:hypothetical protein